MVDFVYWALAVGFIFGFASWVALGVWMILYLHSAFGLAWLVLGICALAYMIQALVVNRPMKTDKPHPEG